MKRNTKPLSKAGIQFLKVMAGDRSLAFVMIGLIGATMLWIGHARNPHHIKPPNRDDVAPTASRRMFTRGAAHSVTASKAWLANTPSLN
jgi:hypothetical protein